MAISHELTAEDRAAIEATSRAFIGAAHAADWKALAGTYTKDAVLMPPHHPAVVGRDDIRAWFASFPPLVEIDLRNVEVRGQGELAYVRGTYTMKIALGGGSPIEDRGKFIEIREKQPDGSWPLSRDIFNSDLPAPG